MDEQKPAKAPISCAATSVYHSEYRFSYITEFFFASLECELLDRRTFQSKTDARRSLASSDRASASPRYCPASWMTGSSQPAACTCSPDVDVLPTRKRPPLAPDERARRTAERKEAAREARALVKVEPHDHDEVLALQVRAAQAAIGHLTWALHTGATSRARIHACAALTALHQIRA